MNAIRTTIAKRPENEAAEKRNGAVEEIYNRDIRQVAVHLMYLQWRSFSWWDGDDDEKSTIFSSPCVILIKLFSNIHSMRRTFPTIARNGSTSHCNPVPKVVASLWSLSQINIRYLRNEYPLIHFVCHFAYRHSQRVILMRCSKKESSVAICLCAKDFTSVRKHQLLFI